MYSQQHTHLLLNDCPCLNNTTQLNYSFIRLFANRTVRLPHATHRPSPSVGPIVHHSSPQVAARAILHAFRSGPLSPVLAARRAFHSHIRASISIHCHLYAFFFASIRRSYGSLVRHSFFLSCVECVYIAWQSPVRMCAPHSHTFHEHIASFDTFGRAHLSHTYANIRYVMHMWVMYTGLLLARKTLV